MISLAVRTSRLRDCANNGEEGGREKNARQVKGGLGGKETRRGVGIIELSAQWSDGGHVVPLMEEEMSFLAELIVQKRAEPLFREALLLSQCTLHPHNLAACAHTHTHKSTCTRTNTFWKKKILECEA